MSDNEALKTLKELINTRFDAMNTRMDLMTAQLEKENERQNQTIDRIADRAVSAGAVKRIYDRLDDIGKELVELAGMAKESTTDRAAAAGTVNRLYERLDDMVKEFSVLAKDLVEIEQNVAYLEYRFKVVRWVGGVVVTILLALLISALKTWLGL